MSDDLVKRLMMRLQEIYDRPHDFSNGQKSEAAGLARDRIEELEERLKAATDDAKEAEAYAGELEAKLAKADKLASEFKNCLEVLTKEDGYVCCSGHQCGCYGASLHAQAIYYANEAIDDYHKITGGKDE